MASLCELGEAGQLGVHSGHCVHLDPAVEEEHVSKGAVMRWLAGILAAVVAGVVTYVITERVGNDGPPAGTTPVATDTSDAGSIADRVLACQHAHNLSAQSAVVKTSDGYLATECAWPAPPYADADGFTQIEVTSVFVPGTAPDNLSVDRIVGRCTTFEAAYDFLVQGGQVIHGPTFTARPGMVVDSDGKPYVEHPEVYGNQLLRQIVGFTPARDELEIVYVEGGELVSLNCV